ncbi:PAS domain-containing sensor histidine kinase [Quatrionicoccus australiensis]|uniref:PAS domain-containing sensor histidine kinase n=1 Tax=Quatrionicoccus australiensis TaxID=138118 RepID=UPI001CFC19B1|nr:PAS domain S-box protein [Quatrionicoccus australiensis]MCB4359042.1 PAS domain S-box protein [Quatrionicoccus australiensis]
MSSAASPVTERLMPLHDMRAILDHVPAMIGYWDRDLRNRFGNCAYQTWFGIDPAVLPGMHIREVIGEERYRLNLPFIEAALRGEEQVFERVIPDPDDASRLRHSFAHYIPDIVDGVVQGFYVLVSDITPIKEIEAAYQASEARYRAVLMDQTELISRISRDGRFVFVNEVYCRFFGKVESELLGKSWQPVVLAEDLPLIEEKLRQMTPDQPVVSIENRVYSGAGELRWMQFVNRGFYAPDGQLLEVQSIGRDITDRKNAENALRRTHDEMEQRVVERTEQLRNLAIEATLSEERERLAIARDLHDELGQLLHVAKIKLDTLGKSLPAEQRGAVRELDTLLADASRQVRSLTSQLTPHVLRNLGLPAALRWLCGEMQTHYGLELECDVDDLPADIALSPAQESILFRGVRELLFNVFKHAGSPCARVSLSCVAAELCIVVEDKGVGMAVVAADERSAGSGFGLLSIRERLAYLGGSMVMDSGSSAGLKVLLRMPLLASAGTRIGE